MEISLWFLLGLVITNLFFFIYWWRGHNIEYTDIFVYIACILSGPFSIMLPLICLFCLIIVRIYMYVEKIYEEPFLVGRKNIKNKGEANYE